MSLHCYKLSLVRAWPDTIVSLQYYKVIVIALLSSKSQGCKLSLKQSNFLETRKRYMYRFSCLCVCEYSEVEFMCVTVALNWSFSTEFVHRESVIAFFQSCERERYQSRYFYVCSHDLRVCILFFSHSGYRTYQHKFVCTTSWVQLRQSISSLKRSLFSVSSLWVCTYIWNKHLEYPPNYG